MLKKRNRTPITCPNEVAHTKGPEGYVAWHDWAEETMKTHDQEQCPGCGLWLIVKPKKSPDKTFAEDKK